MTTRATLSHRRRFFGNVTVLARRMQAVKGAHGIRITGGSTAMRPDWLASTASRLMVNLLASGTAKARMPRFPLAVPIPPERPATRSLERVEPLRAPLFLAVTGGSFWAVLGHGDPHRDWRADFVTCLVSSTYSTIVLSFGAPRIGRDARVDFIELASIWFGTRIIQPKPSKAAVISGIFMHQIADLA